MSKLRPTSANGRKAESQALRSPDAPRRRQPIDVTPKLSIHQATQTLRLAADVLIGVDCDDPLLNFRVRGLASAVRAVAAELDGILLADARLLPQHLGASPE